jgi:tRNA pseudouridine55 synthase
MTDQNGVIIIDKPPDMTSHDVVLKVKRSLGAKKVGHTGTLDPFATGVLVLGINQGTKLIPHLDKTEKEYLGVMVLGVATDTLDVTGNVVAEKEVYDISLVDVERAMESFIGDIEQRPPVYSAVKINGVRLYELARKGIEVKAAKKRVRISSLELVDFSPPRVTFSVTCSPGTYIRTLASDIGEKLGTFAHLEELRRTRSGPFTIDEAHSLDEIEAKGNDGWDMVIDLKDAIYDMVELSLSQKDAIKVANGGQISFNEGAAFAPGSTVKLIYDGRLLALAKVEGKNKLNIKPFKVFHK